MGITLNNSDMGTVLGYQFPCKSTVTADGSIIKTVSVAPAKTGTLSTRSDANTGTLTMASGHGFTDGQRLDIYWSGGSRRGVVIGTVATNSVPFDLGAGDDLPIATTAITAMVPTEEAFTVSGSTVSAIALFSDVAGQIVFAESDNTEVKAYSVGDVAGGAQSMIWTSARDSDNPLTGGDITKVYFSHGSSTETATMRAVVLNS